jgi:hypothetical protein
MPRSIEDIERDIAAGKGNLTWFENGICMATIAAFVNEKNILTKSEGNKLNHVNNKKV